jgi:AcrR family transcriptional regulator
MPNSATEIQDRILMQAHDLFMQYGLKSVSMDDISKKIGISKKTIYLYYTDKESLVKSVVELVVTKNSKIQLEQREVSENAIHEEFLIIEHMGDLFKTMNPSIMFDMQKYYPNAFAFFIAHKNTFIHGMIKDNIIRGINEELYKADINIDLLTKFRVESALMPFNTDFQRDLKHNMFEVCKELSEHFMQGIATKKGQKLIEKYKKSI